MTATGGGPARLLRVYGLWITLVTAAVTGAATGASMTAPVVYRSEAIVVIEARVRANTTPVAPEMGTEKQLAQSGLVVEPAAASLSIGSGELLEGLVIGVAPDANVLTFSYTDRDAATAQRRAEALSEAYVAYRNSGESKESDKPTAAVLNSTQHATLVTPAGLPTTPVESSLWIGIGIGLAAGLVLGVGTALIRDRLSDRLRGREDFARVTGVPVLATVPRIGRRLRHDAHRPLILRAPDTPAAESFRYLRSRMQPFIRDDGTAVLVTSAGEREGRTTTAVNLAVALALSGRDVIIVDTDLRRPRVHTSFGDANEVGLTSVLTGECTVGQALRDGPVPRLRLLTAGPPAANAGDLLEGGGFGSALDALRFRCDVVVLDSAPVLSVSDPIVLAALCDHVLLVGDYRRSTRGYVARAVAELGEVTGRCVHGVLLNAPRGAGGLTPRGRIQDTAARPKILEPAADPEPDTQPAPDPAGAESPAEDHVIPETPPRPRMPVIYGTARPGAGSRPG